MKFRLTTKHYAYDQILEEGTEVGEGTPYPEMPVSMHMEPLDDEAKAAYEKHMSKWGGKPPPTEIMKPPDALQPHQTVTSAETKAPKPGPSGMGKKPEGVKL